MTKDQLRALLDGLFTGLEGRLGGRPFLKLIVHGLRLAALGEIDALLSQLGGANLLTLTVDALFAALCAVFPAEAPVIKFVQGLVDSALAKKAGFAG